MVDQGRSDFCVVFSKSLCALQLKQTLISLLFQIAISNHAAFKLDMQAPRSYLRLIYEYELYILANKKVSTAKDHGKSYIKDGQPLLCHFLHYGLLPSPLIDYFLEVWN